MASRTLPDRTDRRTMGATAVEGAPAARMVGSAPEGDRAVDRARITLAGRIAVQTGHGVLDERALPGRQPRVAFALLVLERHRPVAREELAASLWGEQRPATWEPALRGVVSRVRSFAVESGLGAADILHSDGGNYHLRPRGGLEVDVEVAAAQVASSDEALRRGRAEEATVSAAAARGVLARPLLSGAQSEWLESRRREQHLLLLRALEILARARLELGETTEAILAAEAALELDPYRESCYRTIMAGHAAAGNPAEGLVAYERCRRLLADELGIDPSATTRALQVELLGRSDHPRPTATRTNPTRRVSSVTRARPTPDAAPYVGLRTFQEGDADRFFGRDGDVARLLDRLEGSRFLAVLGPSGSGKSSLVRAGLIPALRVGALAGSDTWSVRVLRPGHRPCAALDAATGVAHGRGRRLVVVDQLEEIFVLASDRERGRFLEDLTALASSPRSDVTVVTTLRADLYPRLTDHPRLADLASANQYLVTPLDEVGLAEAIEGPARLADLMLEPSLTQAIILDVARRPGALPLLQQALLELWRRRDGRTLTLEGYRETGGVAAGVARWAESIWDGLDDDERDTARRLLLRLTRPGEGTEDSRLLVPVDQLITGHGQGPLVDQVVDRLTAARLLTSTTSHDGVPQLELSHEALLRAWPRLRGWIDEDRAGLTIHRRLTDATLEWERRGRDPALLYRGVLLAEASTWAARDPRVLNPRERAFLSAGEDATRTAEHRRVRRLRLTVAALLLGIVVTGGLAAVATHQADRSAAQERIATARELASAAVANLGVDAERSVLLALEAVRHTMDADQIVVRDAEEALHRAVMAHRTVDRLPEGGRSLALAPDGAWVAVANGDGRVVLWGEEGSVHGELEVADEPLEAIAVSPDGQRLATADRGGGVQVRAIGGGGPVLGLTSGTAWVTGLAFAPDGRRLAASRTDGIVTVWDLGADSAAPRHLLGHQYEVDHVVFTPDGRRLVSAGQDRTARVWDLVTGEVTVLEGHRWQVTRVAVSPDATVVATASNDGTARTWDLATGQHRLTFPSLAPVESVAFDPTGQRLALGSTDGTVYVYDSSNARQLLLLGGHTAPVEDLVFTHDGEHLVTTSADGTTRRWDVGVEGGRDWLTAPSAYLRFATVAFSPDGRWFAVPDDAEGVVVRDARNGAVRHRLSGHDAWLVGLTFSPDGRWLAATPAHGDFEAGLDELHTAPIWDLRSGALVTVLRGHEDIVNGAVFSPDSRSVVTSALDGTVRTWRVVSGELLDTVELGAAPIGVGFHEDRWYATVAGPDGEVEVWRDGEHRPLHRLRGHDEPVTTVAFDAGLLVTASHRDGAARVWDLASGELVVAVDGHGAPVGHAVLDPAGSELATVGDDGMVRLWAVPSGEERLALDGHRLIATSAAYSPDGRLLATTSPDGTVALRLRSIDDLVRVATQRVTRTLDEAECRRFVPGRDCAGGPALDARTDRATPGG
jgi:WD40 repeat protein/DNA-binding SARP family transcriptional activator